MSSPKVFIFTPADTTGETYRMMADVGCKLVYGEASWQTPQGDNEADRVAMAKDADALTGTSIRSSPITAKIMDGAPNLRIVAKYTFFNQKPLQRKQENKYP